MTLQSSDFARGSLLLPSNGKTIFYVEDHADTLLVTCKLLRLEGYEVCVARSYNEAVGLADQLGRLDLLIVDIQLPDGNGLDLLREFLARFPRLCAIALSGFGMAEDVEKSRIAGFDRHLIKPVLPQYLLTTIAEVLSGSCGSNRTDQSHRDTSSAIRRLSS